MPNSPHRPDRTALPVIRLDAMRGGAEPASDWITATVKLTIGQEPQHLQISVPPGPARLRELLPVFEGLANIVVDVAERQVIARGEAISCKKGCGACCRQLVPLSAAEAHCIAELVAALPEPRQTQVREGFAAARQRLADAGLLEQLQKPSAESGQQLRPLGLAYFALGIACPFLEDESCSIHADRPLTCREYLVTSPAENCARPSPETVRCVPMPGRVSSAVRELEKADSTDAPNWVPLSLALEWAASHPEPAPTRPAPELVQGVFANLAKKRDLAQ